MKTSIQELKDFLEFEEKPDAQCDKCRISDVDIIPDLESQFHVVTNQRIDNTVFDDVVSPFVFLSIQMFEAWIVIIADMLISKGWLDFELLEILDDPMLDGSDLYVDFGEDEDDGDIRVLDISGYGDVLAYARNVEALRMLCRQALGLDEP